MKFETRGNGTHPDEMPPSGGGSQADPVRPDEVQRSPYDFIDPELILVESYGKKLGEDLAADTGEMRRVAATALGHSYPDTFNAGQNAAGAAYVSTVAGPDALKQAEPTPAVEVSERTTESLQQKIANTNYVVTSTPIGERREERPLG